MSTNIQEVGAFSDDQLLTLAYCRTLAQYMSMVQDYLNGKCPFCDPLDLKTNNVIHEVDCWRMWANPFALKHTELHLVLAPVRHIGAEHRLDIDDFIAQGKLFVWAQKEFGFTGGGLCMRFGGPKLSSCSVLHLHSNIIVPDLSGNVRMTIAKDPHEIAEQVARRHVFEKLRQGARPDALNATERKLVEGRL